MSFGNKEKLDALKSITANSMVMRAYDRNDQNIGSLITLSTDLATAINKLDRGQLGPHELIEHLLSIGVILTPGAKEINKELAFYAMRVLALRKRRHIWPDTLMKRLREFQMFLIYAQSCHVVEKDERIDHIQDSTLAKKGIMDYELIEKGLIRKIKDKRKKKKSKYEEAPE